MAKAWRRLRHSPARPWRPAPSARRSALRCHRPTCHGGGLRVEGISPPFLSRILHCHAGGAAVGNFHQLRLSLSGVPPADLTPAKRWPASKPDRRRFDIADRACTW
ncbi:hypothetical protein KIF59_10240 [Enterobacter cloacae subsp. cloacae]|nr:hypothetical protein [Enterobacter cloacae subsp. cloacae]